MSGSKRVFRPDDLGDWDYARELGDPGQYPFTRGLYETMYRGKLWTMRQFTGFGSVADTNARFKFNLAQAGEEALQRGEVGLSVAFDLPTLMGLDSDDTRCRGHVGYDGVAIDTLEDFERLFDGIPLDRVSVSMTINAPAVVLLAMYIALAKKRGIPLEKLRGTTQADILKEYIAQKEWIFPPEPSMRLVTDMVEHCARELPLWYSLSISGYHIREAGATAAEELAFTLADGIAYVHAGVKRGVPVDDFAPRLSFFWDIHNNFFEEIGKLRAARRMWARIMRDRFGAKDPRSWRLRAHSQTAGMTLTAQDPLQNIARVALQALAAVLGGTQSLHTNSFDEALCLPTEEAAKVALRTQQIIAYESRVPEVADPLGGSYYLECLTNTIEAGAQKLIDEIDAMGGMVAAIHQGFPQGVIRASAARYQKEVEEGKMTVAGVNRFAAPDSASKIPILEISQTVEEQQIARLREFRARRDDATPRIALERLRISAKSPSVNLMLPLIDAVESDATLGEICKTLGEVFGSWRERVAVGVVSSGSEGLHEICENFQFPKRVRILLAKAGLDGHDRGIHVLSRLFEAMGGEVIYAGLHVTVDEVARIAIQEDVDFVGLSVLIGSPRYFFSSIRERLLAAPTGRDMVIFGGGIINPRDYAYLKSCGIEGLFLPGASLAQIARFVAEKAQELETQRRSACI